MKQLKIKRKKKRVFFGMLLGNLGASLLGNLLTGKGTIRAGEGSVKEVRFFNAASSFDKFSKTKVLLELT